MAKRDSEKSNKIFDLLNIMFLMVLKKNGTKKGSNEVYKADVIYDKVHNFQVDYLYIKIF